MIQHGRKVTMKWPNGSVITGFIHPTEGGGANIAFGPGGMWGVNYILPAVNGDEPQVLEHFAETEVEWHEPPGFGAVIRASQKGDQFLDLWVHMGGLWYKDEQYYRHWVDFDQNTLEVLTDGIVE